MSFMRFAYDQFGLPVFQAGDKRFDALGSWLTTDISTHALVALDALAMLADVAQGRPPFEEWSSDNYEVTFEPGGVSISNQWVDSEHGRYPLPEFREALEQYWAFLRNSPDNPHVVREFHPDLPHWEAALLRWEEKWGRPHPDRGRLF